MKIKDVAHNHSLTDLLKVGIFSILMLAPMINVGVRSAYVICNKNAYQSYSGNQEELTKQNNLNYGITYKYEFINDHTGQTNNTTGLIEIDYFSLSLETNTKYIRFNDGNGVSMYDSNSSLIGSLTQINEVYYTVKQTNTTNLIQQPWFINYQVNYVKGNLDNVFEYSVNQLTESPLYNWVENTAIYSGVALMNTQLGITQPVISLLVVYWLLLTIIYIIIDIVIRVFTWLTHMIGSKTA